MRCIDQYGTAPIPFRAAERRAARTGQSGLAVRRGLLFRPLVCKTGRSSDSEGGNPEGAGWRGCFFAYFLAEARK